MLRHRGGHRGEDGRKHYLNMAALPEAREAVDHRIFRNGLEDHFQDLEILDLLVRRNAVGKQARGADQLDLQVCPDQVQLLPQGDDVAPLAQDRPVIAAQMGNRLFE